VEQLLLEGWKLGLKAVAIYRDNCKVAQPLSADKKKTAEVATAAGAPVRRRLPSTRPGKTFSFSVGEADGYIIAGEYPEDGIGEIFLKVAKQGSTLAGIMDAFAISVSLGLQYGVPLEAYVQKFTNMRFEPSGITSDKDIRFATSLVDYIFRRLALEYLPAETRKALGVHSTEERKETANEHANGDASAPKETPQIVDVSVEGGRGEAQGAAEAKAQDAPLCYSCGSRMQPAGSCYVCNACGATSGCS